MKYGQDRLYETTTVRSDCLKIRANLIPVLVELAGIFLVESYSPKVIAKAEILLNCVVSWYFKSKLSPSSRMSPTKFKA